jgi:hypothetical protein
MTDDHEATVPVWTLATGDVQGPSLASGELMTAERLAELRGVLASLASEPIATLEVHPLPAGLDRRRGIPLDAASPLAEHLSQFVKQSAKTSMTSAKATNAGENLYRMVVPAKVAAQFGEGVVSSMKAKGIPGGVYDGLVNAKGVIEAKAVFVPVGKAAAAGAAGGAGATAGVAVAGATALTVAAPLVLMAVAVGVSAHADQQRQQAIAHITELLEQLHEDTLKEERSQLAACRGAIDKATAILLDQGKIGLSLGLDSAAHVIDVGLEKAEGRLAEWQSALDKLPEGKAVEIDTLTKAFPGIDNDGGVFRTHLQLAALAIALGKRVNVLQAVEHAQQDTGNLFDNFTLVLKTYQRRLDKLESGIAEVLERLSALELTRPQGLRPVFKSKEVDHMLRAAHLIHKLADDARASARAADVAIDIAREKDGSVVVFPAFAA